MNNLLEKIHNELCPDIPLDSPEFSIRLLEETIKLRRQVGKDNENE